MGSLYSASAHTVLWASGLLLFFLLAIGASAQVTFSDEIFVTGQDRNPKSVFSADIDGDGDYDVLTASLDNNRISWYENLDGQGSFGLQRIITTDAYSATSVFSIDIDGDGDFDVLSSSWWDDKIAWYENLDGQGSFSQQQVINTNADGAQSVFCADLDGDGDYDVLSASLDDNKIAWYENLNGQGNFSQQRVITTNAQAATSVFSVDLDGDGDYDVLSASWDDDKIAWYENTDGLGNFGPQQIITTNANGAKSVFSADLDGDGDNDVLSASRFDNKIAWYENTDGLGNFGPQQIISIEARGARSVCSADLDGDGDYDIISGSSGDGKIAWYENTDGLGNFGPQQVICTEALNTRSVTSSDLDGDGDYDVISASYFEDKIAWYENVDGQGAFGAQQLIAAGTEDARAVFSVDLDGDYDLDVISGSERDNKIAWYENVDGRGSFGLQQVISLDVQGIRSIYSADLDGDGDKDVLSASHYGGRVAWYENMNGQGSFGQQQIIDMPAYPEVVFSADLDGDGDNDVIMGSSYDEIIAWYRNIDGAGNFGQRRVITHDVVRPHSIYCADLDGDGDNDVLSASTYDDKIAWYENTDGQGNFGPQQIISANADYAKSVCSEDLDGDGDKDVISASSGDEKIVWYENTDGQGNFSAQNIITTHAEGVESIFCADLDGDGDFDVLSASSRAWEVHDKVAWHENIDGLGNFAPPQLISNQVDGVESVFGADLDGDEDVDVLSASFDDDKVVWY